MAQKISLVWFKRDLRVHDHAPLAAACAIGAPVIPLYVVEPDYWRQQFAARRHWHFIYDSLVELRDDCMGLGQPLIMRKGLVTDILNNIRHKFGFVILYSFKTYSRSIL